MSRFIVVRKQTRSEKRRHEYGIRFWLYRESQQKRESILQHTVAAVDRRATPIGSSKPWRTSPGSKISKEFSVLQAREGISAESIRFSRRLRRGTGRNNRRKKLLLILNREIQGFRRRPIVRDYSNDRTVEHSIGRKPKRV